MSNLNVKTILIFFVTFYFPFAVFSHPHSLPIVDGIAIPYNSEFPTAAEGYSNIDGCSSSPDDTPAYDFHSACDQHDRCWRTYGSDPMFCNNEFFHDMVKSCGGLIGLPVISDLIAVMGAMPSTTLYMTEEVLAALISDITTGVEKASVLYAEAIVVHYMPSIVNPSSSSWSDFIPRGIFFKPSAGGPSKKLTTRSTLPDRVVIIWESDNGDAVYMSEESYDTLNEDVIDQIKIVFNTVSFTLGQSSCLTAAIGYKTATDAAIPFIFPETQNAAKNYDSWMSQYVKTIKVLPIINTLLLD